MSEHGHHPDAAIAPESELEGAYEHEHEHEHGGDGAEHAPKKAPRFPFAHRSKAGVAKWKRETRFGVAALLSFVILVSVLLVNKGKKGPKPPSLAIRVAQASSADSSSSKAKADPVVDKDGNINKDQAKSEAKVQDENRDPKKEDVTPPAPAPAPKEPNREIPPPEDSSILFADAKVQTPGTESIRESIPAAGVDPPLPPLATPNNLDNANSNQAKGAESTLPLPATTAEPAAADESTKNTPAPPDPAPAPAPPTESNLLPPSESEPQKPGQIPPTDLATPIDAQAPEAGASNQAAAPPAPQPDASAPAQPAAPPAATPDASGSAQPAAPPAATPDASVPTQPAAPPAATPDASVPTEPVAAPALLPDANAPAQADAPPAPSPAPGSEVPPPSTVTEPTSGTGQTAAVVEPASKGGAPAIRPAEEVPNFDKPPSSDDAMAVSSAPPEIKPGEGIPIPNAGKGRSLEEDLPAKVAPAAAAAGASLAAGAGAGAVMAKAEADDDKQDQLSPELHVVQSGENFWTISKYYYRSGRYYMALWKANSRTVSAADQLMVGQTIVIPPPEALDPRWIEAPRKTTSSPSRASSPIRKTSRSKLKEDDASVHPSSEVELILPIDNSMLTRRSRSQAADEVDPPPGKRYQASRPRYKVRAHDTLRSIARDTLNDPYRDDEIYDLNRDILNDDRHNLVEGQILELPEEARLGRASR